MTTHGMYIRQHDDSEDHDHDVHYIRNTVANNNIHNIRNTADDDVHDVRNTVGDDDVAHATQ
jgi:hypothetical protein